MAACWSFQPLARRNSSVLSSNTSRNRAAQLQKEKRSSTSSASGGPASHKANLLQYLLAPHGSRAAPQPMGAVSAAADGVVALFSLIMAIAAPLFDSQIVLPRRLYPAPLVDIHRWFIAEFDHYLVADPPPFFIGLVWLDLAFLWPVCVANLYGILARRRWATTTSLMAGIYMITYLSAILGEMLGSGKTTRRLLQLYVPFVVFAVTAVLRGLCSCSAPLNAAVSLATSAQKKMV